MGWSGEWQVRGEVDSGQGESVFDGKTLPKLIYLDDCVLELVETNVEKIFTLLTVMTIKSK